MDDAPAAFRAAYERSGSHLVVYLDGELDVATAVGLAEAIVGQASRDWVEVVVLELDGITFCDSSGLRVLVEVAAHQREAGKGFTITRPLPAQLNLLCEITGAAEVLANHRPDLDAAVQPPPAI